MRVGRDRERVRDGEKERVGGKNRQRRRDSKGKKWKERERGQSNISTFVLCGTSSRLFPPHPQTNPEIPAIYSIHCQVKLNHYWYTAKPK